MKHSLKHDTIQELRLRILKMQDAKKTLPTVDAIGLGDLETAFPGGVFPKGAVHEFTSYEPESAAATSGFLTSLLHHLVRPNAFCLWISAKRMVFPPALKLLGLDPECVIFIDLKNDKEVLWALEEGLRCKSLFAVVGELNELTFAQSRRLLLTLEESQVTGLVHRLSPKTEPATACAARWKISPLPGIIEPGLPGIGFPKWRVELTKVKNGRTGSWMLGWTPSGFASIAKTTDEITPTETVKYA